MNRSLQPLALILAVGVLIGLRLVVGRDIVSGLFSSRPLDRQGTPTSQPDALSASLAARIEKLETELGIKRSADHSLVAANVINKTSASFRQLIKIDRGSQDGVAVNQPVMAGGYLIGLVIETADKSATVRLLGDPDLNIAVVTGGADGLATAKAGGVVVSELNDNGRATTGQAVLTSGLGGLYPPDLPLGNLGARLSGDILSEFALDRPFNLSQLSLVQVVVP